MGVHCNWHDRCVHQSCPCSWLARWRGVLHEYKVMITMTAPAQQDVIYNIVIARVIYIVMWLTMAFESFLKSYRLVADNDIECNSARTWWKLKASVCNWIVYVCVSVSINGLKLKISQLLLSSSWILLHSSTFHWILYALLQDAIYRTKLISWNHLGTATCR